MKKIIFSSVLLFFMATSIFAGPNPIVLRLSQQEIAQNKTPSAVAYNYVSAIYAENWPLMLSYLSKEGREWTDYMMTEGSLRSYKELFSYEGSKFNILGWKSCMQNGYEIAVLYVQDEGERNGMEYIRVYVHCVPSSEINYRGFQDITRCNDANPKIILVKEAGQWKVDGFK